MPYLATALCLAAFCTLTKLTRHRIMHYHLLPRGSTPGTSKGTQGEWYSFGVSSFPAREGVKFWKRLRWTTGTC